MIRLAILAAALALACSPALAAPPPEVGDRAPNFELKLVDGSRVTLAELRGQVVVLNFWATWCGPCKRELPLLDGYYRLQRGHGLRVFAVTTEDSIPAYQLKPLFRALAISPAKALKGPYAPLAALPTNYVIDRAGRVRYAQAGAFELDQLNAVLVPLLNEPVPSH
jgi:peroxiredoxin